MGRPLIGITSGLDYEKGMLYVKNGYWEAVLEAGGLPLAIPPAEGEGVLEDFLKICDGILLTGGGDVDAKHFGEDNLPFGGEISPHRDAAEIYLARRAVELDKPLFGICRGIQVINAAMGGTLYQDICAQLKETVPLKHSQQAPVWYPTHRIFPEEGSRVWASFGGKGEVYVNSFHHQAVKDVAPCFRATSRAPDGIVESIEHRSNRFALGVQWHPELMWRQDAAFLNLFKEFINAAGCDKI